MIEDNLHFIHISDSHIGPTRDHCLHGVNTFQRATAIVDAINALAASPDVPLDFVVHSGDLTTDGDEGSYEGDSTILAARIFGQLNPQMHLVNGNHDHLGDLETHFPASDFSTPLSGDTHHPTRAAYFEQKGRLFVTLDARPIPIDPEFDPRGRLPEQQLEALARLLAERQRPTTLFMHYPPVELDCRWIDDWMMVKYAAGQATLHDILMSSGIKIEGVFFGHVHRGVQVVRDGILYASVAGSSCHFDAWPKSNGPFANGEVDSGAVAFFNYVALTPRATVVKQHWVSVALA